MTPQALDPIKLRDALLGHGGVDIRDRSHRLKTYAQCFTGRDMVDWLTTHQPMTRSQAQRMGELFIAKGWIEHVTQEHDFEDSFLYYRVPEGEATEALYKGQGRLAALNQISLNDLTQRMRQAGGVEQRDRYRWLMKIPNAFSGREATDWISRTYSLSRREAELLAQRLLASNKIRHVLDEKNFIDGAVYYRYV
jgi:Domain found in Dishevelled, Egl-10, and Pleckstrin (DEP)